MRRTLVQEWKSRRIRVASAFIRGSGAHISAFHVVFPQPAGVESVIYALPPDRKLSAGAVAGRRAVYGLGVGRKLPVGGSLARRTESCGGPSDQSIGTGWGARAVAVSGRGTEPLVFRDLGIS